MYSGVTAALIHFEITGLAMVRVVEEAVSVGGNREGGRLGGGVLSVSRCAVSWRLSEVVVVEGQILASGMLRAVERY